MVRTKKVNGPENKHKEINKKKTTKHKTAKLQWLEHFWDHGNLLDMGSLSHSVNHSTKSGGKWG